MSTFPRVSFPGSSGSLPFPFHISGSTKPLGLYPPGILSPHLLLLPTHTPVPTRSPGSLSQGPLAVYLSPFISLALLHPQDPTHLGSLAPTFFYYLRTLQCPIALFLPQLHRSPFPTSLHFQKDRTSPPLPLEPKLTGIQQAAVLMTQLQGFMALPQTG